MRFYADMTEPTGTRPENASGDRLPAPPGEVRHLYVHVPFCDGKCLYCGFYSRRYTAPAADAYIDAVLRELALRLCSAQILPALRTLYVGGGTPSVLSASQLARLCEGLADRLRMERVEEWTVEANPGAVTGAKAKALRETGVNRVSVGAQSFSDAVLKALGRRHGAADIDRTLLVLRRSGFENVNLDLIACVPGVDTAAWGETIRRAVEIAPAHVSVYAASVEEGSRLADSEDAARWREAGERREPIRQAQRLLERAGYERYEVSNYGMPGRACLHNLGYWRGEDYLGLGPSASSRIGRRRWTNRADTGEYVAALSRGVLPEREEEELDGATDASERIMFGFRLREGVDLAGFCARWGEPARVLAPAWESTLRALTVAGHVRKSGRRWRPTRSGLDLADAIAREILAARGTQASGPDRIAWSTVTRSVCASTGLTT